MRQRTDHPHPRAHDARLSNVEETRMSKGNKETKKPKKIHVPNPPGLPANLAPAATGALKPKKR